MLARLVGLGRFADRGSLETMATSMQSSINNTLKALEKEEGCPPDAISIALDTVDADEWRTVFLLAEFHGKTP